MRLMASSTSSPNRLHPRSPRLLQLEAERKREEPAASVTDPKLGTVPNFGSVTDAAGSSLFRSASSCNNRGLRGCSRFGDDVDDAINRIGSPQRCSRTANHFNPVQIFKHHVLDIPVHAGK